MNMNSVQVPSPRDFDIEAIRHGRIRKRIRWSHEDYVIMHNHLASHQLHLGNCQVDFMNEIASQLRLSFRDASIRALIRTKLGAALVYQLRKLARQGYVTLWRYHDGSHGSTWMPYTITMFHGSGHAGVSELSGGIHHHPHCCYCVQPCRQFGSQPLVEARIPQVLPSLPSVLGAYKPPMTQTSRTITPRHDFRRVPYELPGPPSIGQLGGLRDPAVKARMQAWHATSSTAP